MEAPKIDSGSDMQQRRLWIGNLDPRITEFHLIKLVQKCGSIEKFNLMFHRTGPLMGQPRGYAFVTYVNREDAVQAKTRLDGTLIGQRNVKVTWAHNVINYEDAEKSKQDVVIPALAMTKEDKKKDKDIQIQLIEAKLKMMERRSEVELKINDTVASKQPVIQYNKPSASTNTSSTTYHKMRSLPKRQDKYLKPYSRHKSYIR